MTRFVGFVMVLAFCVVGTPLCNAEVKESVRNRMDKVYAAFRTLPEYTSDEKKFSDPENEKEILRLIDSLRTNFHGDALFQADNAEDPGYASTLRVLRDMLDDARNRFAEGRKGYARWRLKNTTNYCISCHSRDQVDQNFPGVEQHLEELNAYEKGEFYFATRRFALARRSFLEAAADQNLSLYRMDALRKWLVIYTRVQPKPLEALRTLERFRKKGILTRYEDTEVKGWMTSLRRWRTERTSISTSALRKAENLMRQAESVSNSVLDGRGTVEYLRATSILHGLLEDGKVKQADRGHVLYLLGKAYSSLPNVFVYELPDLFLEQCIRESPGSDDAKKCYGIYRENVVVGFSGSGGTRIPDDVEENLRELHRLANGVPLPPSRI